MLEDTHTGAFFGGAAWLLYDLVAIALIGFVATGIYMWMVPLLLRRRKRKAATAKLSARTPDVLPAGATARVVD